jgi:hypothetical protein
MARPGYDPRDLAHMFETIESQAKQGGGDGPEWLSSHPNPGNRTQYITKEAEALTIATPADTTAFAPIKTEFASLPAAKTTAEVERGKGKSTEDTAMSVGTPGQPVPRPSTQYRDITAGNVFRASVPGEWTGLQSDNAVKVVPQNGYGQLNGQTVFTYGVEFGIARVGTNDLKDATTAWLRAVARSNPELRLAGSQRSVRMSQRAALETPLVNPSALGGQERIVVSTTLLSEGTLFYYVTVVPDNDAAAFEETFRRIGDSIRLADAH